MVVDNKTIVKTTYHEIKPYTTKDGAIIRELMHPERHGNSHQSLAEATVPVGISTVLHRHRRSEEIYHITAGQGRMTLGRKTFGVEVGDTVYIPVGTFHKLHNSGTEPLKLLCCCVPPYSHDDTELTV